MKLTRDGWAGLVVLAASLVLFALTLKLRPSALVPVGPGFYPRLVLGLSAILSAGLVVADLLGKNAPRPLPQANYRAVILHFALFGAYVVSLPWIGFRVATFAYIATANALLELPRTRLAWLRPVALALITSAVIYYAFERYLAVLLPRGLLTDF